MAPRMRIHNVKCDECDWEHTYTTYQRSIVAITAHRKWRHPRDTRGIEHVLGNAASLRLAVEAAKARGRMYLARLPGIAVSAHDVSRRYGCGVPYP